MTTMADTAALEHAGPATARTAVRIEQIGTLALIGMAAAVHFSIAVAQTLFAVSALCWIALMVIRGDRFAAPTFFWPLVALGALTLVSAAFSPQPAVSFADTKQLLLFLIVPVAYRFATTSNASTMVTVTVSAAAASAAYGIFQYGLLDYNELGMRVRGTLGHWMTYSGLLMLVIAVALARILFSQRDRLWAALVMPALTVAVIVTFTRSALVGTCAAAAVLLLLKDFRLVALLPVALAVFFTVAPTNLTARYISIFDLTNATNRDRLAMLREGRQMIRAHPIVGIGPNMVEQLYSDYRDSDAVEETNPHLHNVPLQIAAERGLPALGAWLCFVATVLLGLMRGLRARHDVALRAAALAAMTAMLAAGLFEYNFGDSEFLMLLLLVITLPAAAERADSDRTA